MIDPGPSREAWSARYERLRADWFAQRVGWGQTLFLRQGMLAWMEAWPAAMPSESETGGADVRCEAALSPTGTTSGGVRRELVRAIANLILHRRQEVWA